MTILGTGSSHQFLTDEQIESIVVSGLDGLNLAGKRVLVLIPDGTRTMPLALFFRLITNQLMGKVKKLDFMVALGTHSAMRDEAILKMVGITAEEKQPAIPLSTCITTPGRTRLP